MTKILHIIQCLASGGAPRAMIATAKYSSQFGDFQHRVASLLPIDPNGLKLAEEARLTVMVPEDRKALLNEIEAADIVHIDWWNTPEMYELFLSELPEMRLLIFFHIRGDTPPQMISEKLVNFGDFCVAGSPYTYELPVFLNLSPNVRSEKIAMIYGGSDFARLNSLEPKSHDTFNVGYVGTVTTVKMHPNYMFMSAAVDVPNVRFIVCGLFADDELHQQAQKLGVTERFDFRGFVEDIKSVYEVIDVFGYPLCEENYASGEMVLHEAMYAGIPPVVFPYGGPKSVVINDYTGFVVHSELEYKQAIEYLYHNPEERKRLGSNAKEYARQIFGAENAAKKINPVYVRMMQCPKRKHSWNAESTLSLLDQSITIEDLTNERCDDMMSSGAEMFIESLGFAAESFIKSLQSTDINELFDAERKIAQSPRVLFASDTGGILQYEGYYPTDPYLRLWAGLVWQQIGEYDNALSDFQSAINIGFKHWRVYWYLAQATEKAGNLKLAKKSLNTVLKSAPDFADAHEMSKRIGEIEIGPEEEPERFSISCPHCEEVLYVDRKGRWQCPCCKNDFVV